jgi:alpha-tubulin suppressor-like RCC1 family protein
MVVTNYKENGADLGDIYVTKEYVMEYYSDLISGIKVPQLWTWGDNTYGQLGNNTNIDKSVPTTISGAGTTWKIVTISSRNMYGIKTDGTLWAWGSDQYGHLGDNSTVNKSSPVTTSGGGTNWSKISAGSFGSFGFAMAIKTDGTLWGWGWNNNGQLGNNSVAHKSSPITVSGGGTTWSQVSCGQEATAAIKTDGTLWTWGSNYAGQLGNNSTINRSSPGTIAGAGTTWSKVSCGYYCIAAIKIDNSLWTWGYNGAYGQLGNTSQNDTSSPGSISGGGEWKHISCGNEFMLGIKIDGTLWGWGDNQSGQLCINPSVFTSSPRQNQYGGTNWKNIKATDLSAFGIKTDGTLWAWGRQYIGILGTGGISNQSSPVTIFGGGTNWKTLPIGSFNSQSMIAISEAEGW